MVKLIALIVLTSAAANAETFFSLRPSCGNLAAFQATQQVNAKFPTAGFWYIQDFKTLTIAQDYEFIMQSNSLVETPGQDKQPCAKVTVHAHAGATDCKILAVNVTKLEPVASNVLCKAN
jgi:hypothetical protein